jgi:hypothetical protein
VLWDCYRTFGSVGLAGFVLATVPAGPLSGQQPAIQIRYHASQLHCARFLESARTIIRTESGGKTREQTSGRRGVWRFLATSAPPGVKLEGWLDSLTLWRRSPETMTRPDTDGLIGGRFRGSLSLTGSYLEEARPFVPDEVADVAGMGTALEDFFPPLPPSHLERDGSWADSLGLNIRRLPDSGLSGVPLYRYELVRRQRDRREAAVPRDTLEIKEVSREGGSFVWHPTLGLLRRDRHIVVETTVPAGGAVRRPVRSRIEQRITITRDLGALRSEAQECGAQETAAQDRTGGRSSQTTQ